MKISNELYAKIKESVEFFDAFTPGELLSLLQVAEAIEYEKGDVVFEEGSESDKMYIIKEGTVQITHTVGKSEKTLAKVTAGNCFGEMGAVDQAPRSATATVIDGPATILAISAGVLTKKNKDIALKFFQSFAKMLSLRLREKNKKA